MNVLSWAGLKRNPYSVLARKSTGPFGRGLEPLLENFAANSARSLPRDGAPKASIIQPVVAVNELRAVKKRGTVFVIDLLHNRDGATVSRTEVRTGRIPGMAPLYAWYISCSSLP